MKVEFWNKEGSVLLTRSGGESLKVSIMEFWEICRYGARLDVKQEIDNYLSDNGECAGVDADVIRSSEAFLDEVVDRVLDTRASRENSDQIYDAISHCLKHGKHKDGLHQEKSLADMDVEDCKDPERKRNFNELMHAYRDLKRRMHEQNEMPFGGDRNMQNFLKMRLGDVTTEMDLLRVKEWLSRQPYDLDIESPQYREAMDMLEEICGWAFPELAGMVFDGEDNDLIFQEPGGYTWFHYNPDANAGGQIVGIPFDEEDACRMFGHLDPISLVGNKCWLEDIDKKGFFLTIFDMLEMKEDGKLVGTDIQCVCQDIFAEHWKKSGYVIIDSVEQSHWHGEVDVPYGFPGLEEIDYDSMELASEGLLNKRLGSVGLFENISVERAGYYKDGVGYSFSFTANLREDAAGQLLQKALDGLKFEACSDVQKVSLGERLEDAAQRSCESSAQGVAVAREGIDK